MNVNGSRNTKEVGLDHSHVIDTQIINYTFPLYSYSSCSKHVLIIASPSTATDTLNTRRITPRRWLSRSEQRITLNESLLHCLSLYCLVIIWRQILLARTRCEESETGRRRHEVGHVLGIWAQLILADVKGVLTHGELFQELVDLQLCG